MTILIEKEHFYGSCKGADSTDYFTKQLKRKRQILIRSDTKLPQPFVSWSNSL